VVDALPVSLWRAGLQYKANLLWCEVEATQLPPDALFINQTLHYTVCFPTALQILVICKAKQDLTYTLFRQILQFWEHIIPWLQHISHNNI
jgi:hypothetical protein